MKKPFEEAASSLIESMEKVARLPKSREVSLAFTKLEESLMWLMKGDHMNKMNQPVDGVGHGKT